MRAEVFFMQTRVLRASRGRDTKTIIHRTTLSGRADVRKLPRAERNRERWYFYFTNRCLVSEMRYRREDRISKPQLCKHNSEGLRSGDGVASNITRS